MKRPLVILAYPKIDHEKDYVYFWMPFSVLAIAKVLIDDDLAEVVVFDGNQKSEADWELLLSRLGDRAACIGMSIMTGGGQIRHALDLAEIAKHVGCRAPIVFGGPHVNVLPDQTLAHPLVDAVLVGVGQTSMSAFVRALQGEIAFSEVPGLKMKPKTAAAAATVVGPPNPPRTQQLGGYPWHLIDVKDYIRNDPTISPRTLNYVSSQGCVYQCRFCYELTYKRKYSRIPADILVDDIDALVSQYALDGIKFYDADWFIDLKRALGFAEGLIDRRIRIRWAGSINPNDILKARRQQPELMRKLADSGCSRLLMGVESGADRVLRDIVKKEVTRAQVLDVAREIADHGILGSYTFIVGFPGETQDEQAQTYDFIEELWRLYPRPETRVHIFAPYPGTPLFEASLQNGFVPPSRLEDWASYDYYQSQTPWTDKQTAIRARQFTKMCLPPAA
jgi:anaerobic magnesium-protoporphyrin IX monomethyl ester cyclase